MSRIIQDTFNTYWLIRYGKNAREICFPMLAILCELENDPLLDGKSFMKDCMGVMGKWVSKEDEMTEDDWKNMIADAESVHARYIQWQSARKIIQAITNYIEEAHQHEQEA